MGKKSRRKGGAAGGSTKAARKERLQERREQQLEEAVHRTEGPADDGREGREFFVGDRVWYAVNVHGLLHRGIVQSVTHDASPLVSASRLVVAPLDPEEAPSIETSTKDTVPDFCNLTLRFGVGDEVVCRSHDDEWLEATVTSLWPLGGHVLVARFLPGEGVPCYECDSGRIDVVIDRDEDWQIRRRPSSFRLAVGDRVVFDAANAEFTKRINTSQGWMEGVITSVHLLGREYYAAYECTFSQGGRQHAAHILEDDDEHIARADANPRDRLFEAIAQRCSRKHLVHLTTAFNIDVATFKDLLVTKAVEHASYPALAWLQKDCDTPIQRIKDDAGNNILHTIASSANAAHFVMDASWVNFVDRRCKLDWGDDFKTRMTNAVNDQGETWLHILVRRGDTRALDLALSPITGLAWDLSRRYYFDGDNLKSLGDSIQSTGNPTMAHIYESFVSFRTQYERCTAIETCARQSPDDFFAKNNSMAAFRGKDASRHAKRLARFFLDWRRYTDRLCRNPFPTLVTSGFSELFQLMHSANEALFRNEEYTAWACDDRNEYIQPELVNGSEEDDSSDTCLWTSDIFLACIVGSDGPTRRSKTEIFWRDLYLQHVKKHAVSCDKSRCPSLLSHVERVKDDQGTRSHDFVNFLENKCKFLKDDISVEGRVEILRYLVQKHPNAKLDVLETIRHRQCGVLRFLVGSVALTSTLIKQFQKWVAKLDFLENGRIPSSLSTKGFLCFATIQFDDLQSLQLLCESSPVLTEICDGFNLLHFAAFVGRVEIVAWLYSQSSWQTLVDEVCHRKPFQNAYALHIAASRGHIFLADMMLDFGVQATDRKGNGPEYYAKKSDHEFVREWASEREEPAALERDIKKLLKIINATNVSAEILKKCLTTTKCLDPSAWIHCGYSTYDAQGPLGCSLGGIARECCSKCPDQNVTSWICAKLYFWDGIYGHEFWDREMVGNRKMNRDRLISFAGNNGYDDLVKYLQHRCFAEISCVDPVTRDRLLTTVITDNELLQAIRGKLLRLSVLEEIASCSDRAINKLFGKGGTPNELDDLWCINSEVKKTLIEEGHVNANYGFDRNRLEWINLTQDMSTEFVYDMGEEYGDQHPLTKQLPFGGKSPHELSQVHIVLATEGYSDLLEYCLANVTGWTASMEVDVTRIAAFFGNSTMLELMMQPPEKVTLLSEPSDRSQGAILGAGESCRWRDLLHLVDTHGIPHDPVREQLPPEDPDEDFETRYKTRRLVLNKSLMCAVINGYLGEAYDGDNDNKKQLKTLKVIIDKLNYTHENLLKAIELILDRCYLEHWDRMTELIQNAIVALHLQPILHHEQMQSICKLFVQNCSRNYKADGKRDSAEHIIHWLGEMADMGIDLQNMTPRECYYSKDKNPFIQQYHELEKRQLQNWSHFDDFKKDGSLADIQGGLNQGTLHIQARYRGGLMLTHLSSAYNRSDLLEWLVASKGMDLDAKDGQGRSALDVAKASKAASATQWIIEWKAKKTIAAYVQRYYHHMRAVRKRNRVMEASTAIQRLFRGYLIRKLYSGVLMHRLEESQHFAVVWGDVIQTIPHSLAQQAPNWSSIRETVSDITHADFAYDDSYFVDTDETLSKALEGALRVGFDDEAQGTDDNVEEARPAPETTTIDLIEGEEKSNASWLTFQMTSHVVKFLRRGDAKYKEFFVRRMQQLASGQRSRILQKRLKGSQSTIYETYLEQKSGFRILWTEEGTNIVIWFVAKHKEVSRLMKLIDDSKNRSARQQLPDAVVVEMQNDYSLSETAERKEVLLDVYGNVPLKIYDVNFQNIDDIARNDWTPKLHLTEEERDIVEEEGTTLVLGRSGTGKTICICNRMEHDRQIYGHDPTFSQLFVARSKRLCRYVSEAVGTCPSSSFCTFEELLYDVDTLLPDAGEGRKFSPSQKVGFHRFKHDFYSNRSVAAHERVGALVLWTAIRTFLKGSIEAFKSPDGVLCRDDFVAVEKLGKNRCRIPADLREYLYDVFQSYEKYKKELGLWDDCDRIRHLLLRLEQSKKEDPAAFELVRRSKVYVDEIQDYTQIECLLFFSLAGPGGLFLAGDPAQSVVQGTEFRFDEIRSVGFFVAGEERRDLIPHKPKTVTVNFRSHAGILNTAGAVLDLLFQHFPGSAKQLKKDLGLFQGARPGVLHKASPEQLAILLSDKLKGTVVLCHDESVPHWRRSLGDYKLVYGIREAKGLEFKSVIILDFFRELPPALMKPWRNMLLNRAGLGFDTEHPLVGTHLKLLYTGITRCIERLFFVETASSIAGDAIVRWLTTSSIRGHLARDRADTLATRNQIDDIEAMAMTSDEFLSEAFNNAELAESAELDLEQARHSLDRAIWCFDQAGHSELAAKARMHRVSIQYRSDLVSAGYEKDQVDLAMIERRGAQMMTSLMKEGLLFEVLNVWYAVNPLLSPYAKTKLEKQLISKVRQALNE